MGTLFTAFPQVVWRPCTLSLGYSFRILSMQAIRHYAQKYIQGGLTHWTAGYSSLEFRAWALAGISSRFGQRFSFSFFSSICCWEAMPVHHPPTLVSLHMVSNRHALQNTAFLVFDVSRHTCDPPWDRSECLARLCCICTTQWHWTVRKVWRLSFTSILTKSFCWIC